MGSYTFKWEEPADEVYVTGTFDEWTKSIKLDKVGDIFKKTVFFEDASEKKYFKFVVDGRWTLNEAAPKEADHQGNVNNFIAPEDMASEEPAAPVIQTVTAESTTADLAGQQPIEKKETDATPSDVPGGFPDASSGDVDQIVSINPLPAAKGGVNPFHLAPGEPVPTFNAQDVDAYVKLDKESYERSDALPGIEPSELQPPSFEGNMIPESGLPMGVANINTISPTTLELASQVPLEPKVPDVVKGSQEEAGFAPEASVVPEELRGKAQVEEELKSKVPEAPVVSESVARATVAATEDTPVEKAEAAPAAAEKPVPAAAAAAADATTQDIPEPAPEPVVEHKEVEEPKAEEAALEVPQEVKESVPEPSTEAAASTAAVEEKTEAEPKVAEESKQEETQTEEVPSAAAVTEAPKTESEAPSAEVIKTEAPAAGVAQPAAEPVAESSAQPSTQPAEPVATEAPTTESKEPESAAATQVDDSAEVIAAAERPTVEIPATETQSERTEISPTAEAPQAVTQANGEDKSGETPSDKKRKNRLSVVLQKFKSKFF